MRKSEMGIGDIIVESLTIFGVILYLGLQMFYICRYPVRGMTMVSHFLTVLLLYGGMIVLQCHPEFLNGRGSEPLTGKVRIYAVRMVRICKFLIVYGILVPSMADIMGMGINEAYSLIVMIGILAVIAYYIYRIYQYNREEERKKKK
ncbi:MAG: hypothetical protein K2P76_16070 [Lachnospiraceae bacterium]|nr:hypothetical protein [Lachnospiraceae bacterium]